MAFGLWEQRKEQHKSDTTYATLSISSANSMWIHLAALPSSNDRCCTSNCIFSADAGM